MKCLTGICLLAFVCSCSRSVITTQWKPQRLITPAYQRILVAVIMPDRDSCIGKLMEQEVIQEVSILGYRAISAAVYFGADSSLFQRQGVTFKQLCEQGVDLVFILALIPATDRHKGNRTGYPDTYYFNRVWHYRRQAAALPVASVCWEAVLFDLADLRAVCVVQTKKMVYPQSTGGYSDNVRKIIAKLLREKVLSRTDRNH